MLRKCFVIPHSGRTWLWAYHVYVYYVIMLYPRLLRDFSMVSSWLLLTAFSAPTEKKDMVIWFLSFLSICTVYWFVNVESFLNPWGKSHLVLVCDLLDELLYSLGWHFEVFCNRIYQPDWSTILVDFVLLLFLSCIGLYLDQANVDHLRIN